MSHGKKKVQQPPEYDWPFEISFKLDRSRPKVAFLSGVPREYYPEDPGHSKFGLTYCLPVDDNPRCQYDPPTDLLDKPISLLGYGIGGLLGPRFLPLDNEDNPAPNVYQSQLVPAPVKRSTKAVRVTWRELVEKYEDIVELQSAKYDREVAGVVAGLPRNSVAVRPVINMKAAKTKSRMKVDLYKEHLKKCPAKFSAFGVGFNNPRFRKNDAEEKVGPGSYEINKSTLKESFQITNPEGKLIPRVRIVCYPSGSDICMECDMKLFEADYYQTKEKFKVLNTVDPQEAKYKRSHLSLCRKCYCEALKKGYPPWLKKDIPLIFMKARHCSSIHDHQEGHVQFLMKSTCKGLKNLQRKELIYSKYFKDHPCEKTR